jgi:hypothetical protein
VINYKLFVVVEIYLTFFFVVATIFESETGHRFPDGFLLIKLALMLPLEQQPPS